MEALLTDKETKVMSNTIAENISVTSKNHHQLLSYYLSCCNIAISEGQNKQLWATNKGVLSIMIGKAPEKLLK